MSLFQWNRFNLIVLSLDSPKALSFIVKVFPFPSLGEEINLSQILENTDFQVYHIKDFPV